MTTPELISYIKDEITKGTTREMIKSNLLSQGWSDLDVHEGLATVAVQQPMTPPAPRVIVPPPPAFSTFTANAMPVNVDGSIERPVTNPAPTISPVTPQVGSNPVQTTAPVASPALANPTPVISNSPIVKTKKTNVIKVIFITIVLFLVLFFATYIFYLRFL